MLFARSIRENLTVGKPDATDAEMMEALDRAQATEVMARQPDGLDTIVGERGRTLSGPAPAAAGRSPRPACLPS